MSDAVVGVATFVLQVLVVLIAVCAFLWFLTCVVVVVLSLSPRGRSFLARWSEALDD